MGSGGRKAENGGRMGSSGRKAENGKRMGSSGWKAENEGEARQGKPWIALRRQLPWFFVLLSVDGMAVLFLWLADVRAFHALAGAMLLATLLLFAAIFSVISHQEQKKGRAFEIFLGNPGEYEEEALLKLCSSEEREWLLLLGRVLREKEAAANELLTRVSDYEEYVEAWAHEAKAPLSLLTLLLDNRRDELPEQVAFRLDYIRSHIQEFVNQMLFYARLKGTQKDYLFEYVGLGDCVREVLEDYRPLLEEKGFRITVAIPEFQVYTDRRGILFLLSQLVSNACKYCDAKTVAAGNGPRPGCGEAATPELVLEAAREGGQYVLSVRDNGIGVRGCDLPYIFEKGFTGDSGDGRKRATGMGLYLAKGIAGELKVSLAAESEWGNWFEMKVVFPVVEEQRFGGGKKVEENF